MNLFCKTLKIHEYYLVRKSKYMQKERDEETCQNSKNDMMNSVFEKKSKLSRI